MLLLFTQRYEKSNAVYENLLISNFLVLNVVLNMPINIQVFLIVIRTMTRENLWWLEYPKMLVKTTYIIYSSIVVY